MLHQLDHEGVLSLAQKENYLSWSRKGWGCSFSGVEWEEKGNFIGAQHLRFCWAKTYLAAVAQTWKAHLVFSCFLDQVLGLEQKTIPVSILFSGLLGITQAYVESEAAALAEN